MISELTHEQAAEEIEAVALGLATEDVSRSVTAHASQCAECAAELASFYQVVTSLSALIPEKQLNRGHSAGIKSRLLAKAAAGREASGRGPARIEIIRAPEPRGAARPAEPRVTPVAAERAPPPRAVRPEEAPRRATRDRSSAPIWIAVVATLIALGSLAAFLNARGRTESSALDAETGSAAIDTRIAELERSVAEKNATIASLSGPGVRIISLYNREAREPLGRMFWDRRSNRWTLFIYELRQPRPGRTFRIWLGTDQGRVALGSFAPSADGTTTFVAEHALPAGALNTVSISEEEQGASGTTVSGPVVLAGALR